MENVASSTQLVVHKQCKASSEASIRVLSLYYRSSPRKLRFLFTLVQYLQPWKMRRETKTKPFRDMFWDSGLSCIRKCTAITFFFTSSFSPETPIGLLFKERLRTTAAQLWPRPGFRQARDDCASLKLFEARVAIFGAAETEAVGSADRVCRRSPITSSSGHVGSSAWQVPCGSWQCRRSSGARENR